MKEELLHFIWKYKLFDVLHLQTTDGDPIEIIHTGVHNKNAGPDFFNARLKIGKTIWAGNVEIHQQASDWNKHHHTNDKLYDNVILHVVYKNDCQVKNTAGYLIPTLDISQYIQPQLLNRYQLLSENDHYFACDALIGSIDSFTFDNWLDRLIVERLEEKAVIIETELDLTIQNWEETFYRLMARSFGFHVNAETFLLLARSISSIIYAKHKTNLLQLEALLFGQGGFLSDHFNDPYFLSLKKEYAFLQKKYSLSPIDNYLWKFLRLRPSNFPTIRISQFAALIYKSSHLFSRIIESNSLKELEELFAVEANDYWNAHYLFGKTTLSSQRKTLGKKSIFIILINVVIPFMFVYGKKMGDETLATKALNLLQTIKSEQNLIVKQFAEVGIKSKNAADSQALLHLKTRYCDKKKCLTCAIGVKLLKKCYNE
ncbi:DUF2851 domain-containing protein [Solitalea longa]|uniref:DUF2851 domain-containing protein n=1 Tax=Solitalea longa TaxID=2079460 RepID=A0A2S5A191_9SPHI|nr:DUF2851 family protein [Solitalea longa]POY36037.1 DUF2851 domain-containing protein [Solitalea longa]